MATVRQKMVVGKIIENHRTDKTYSMGEVLRSVGYGVFMSRHPKAVTKSKGFKEAALDAGLTEEFLLEVLVSDIKAKPQKRTKEVELGFKVLGALNPTDTPIPPGATFNQFNIGDNTPRGQEMVDNFTDYMLKQTLPRETDETTSS